MRRGILQVIGIEGLVLLVFGVLAFVLVRPAVLIWALLFCGAFSCLAVYVVAGWGDLKTGATSRTTRIGVSVTVYALLVLGTVLLLNFWASRHPVQWDLTVERVNQLSDQTEKVLAGLDTEVMIYHFEDGSAGRSVEPLLRRYESASQKVRYRIIDPVREPQLIDAMGVTQYKPSVVVAGEGDNQARYNFRAATEEDVTNAILQVTRKDTRPVYFLEGHGESDVDDQSENGLSIVTQLLKNERFEVVKLLLASQDKMPDDAAAVVVAGPLRSLLPNEIRILTDYLDRGGRAIFLLEPGVETGLELLVSRYGVTMKDAIVFDRYLALFQGETTGSSVIVTDYGFHPITRDFNRETAFFGVRPLSPASPIPQGTDVTELARTSESSWADYDFRNLGPDDRPEPGQNAEYGPFPVAVAIERQSTPSAPPGEDADSAAGSDDEAKPERQAAPWERSSARLVIFGDSDFISNQMTNVYFGTDLFLNAVMWLVEDNARVSIRPRAFSPSFVSFSVVEESVLFYASVFIIPQLMMMIGYAVILWRK